MPVVPGHDNLAMYNVLTHIHVNFLLQGIPGDAGVPGFPGPKGDRGDSGTNGTDGVNVGFHSTFI